MAIPIIDNFKLNSSVPIDNRIVASNSTVRSAITYKYDGLKVFQLDNRVTYIWNNNTSLWDVDSHGTLGQGTYNYVTKWDSTGLGLTDSSIISSPISFNEINQKVGIGGTPMEAFQVESNYSVSAIGTSSMPFVVHKGVNTIIGENWYWDIGLNEDHAFDPNFASSTISFKNGGFEFKGRIAGSPITMKSLMTIENNGVISIVGTESIPDANNGSLYYDSNIPDRVKVKEGGKWRTISRIYGIYTTSLTQSSTSAPIESVLESSIGGGTWSYMGTGVYRLTVTNGFIGTVPNINGFCGPYTSTGVFFGSKIDNSTYEIRTLVSSGGSPQNGLLNSKLIEIRIY